MRKVFENNAYFAHPENLILTMIQDESQTIRELGYRSILKARQHDAGILRRFKTPKLQFDAQTYYSMIDWQNIELSEPPITRKLLSDEKLQELIETKQNLRKYKTFLATRKLWKGLSN